MSSPILKVDNLTVAFGSTPVVEDLSFSVSAGRTLGIIGESGSGKSITALSILRLAEQMGARCSSGQVFFNGSTGIVDLRSQTKKGMQKIRGKEISMIFQEPMTSLNPIFTIGDQVSEVLVLHEKMNKSNALIEVRRLLDMVRLPDSTLMLDRYPHQLSGGMRQRVMIAMALACKPKLLIADEPTTALDVTIQAQILSIIRDVQKEMGMTVIFITHDMGVIAEMADDVVVMRKGRKVEEGKVQDIFHKPSHDYTRALLAAVPRLGSMAGNPLPKRFPLSSGADDSLHLVKEEKTLDTARTERPPVLAVHDLSVRFDVRKGALGRITHRVHAVEKVNFEIYPGETLALVGESGSGKSTIGRTIQQLQKASSGNLQVSGQLLSDLSADGRRRLQRRVQYIFQDPFASLDPRQTVGYSVSEPIRVHALMDDEKKIRSRVSELLEHVGLLPEFASRYPHEFSGGQRQRICIARALASDPELIIADEALSAMDVSIQAQIINLFMDLQERRGIAYLFISHDLAVVERISHRVAVLYLGQIVELGSRTQIFEDPQHPYTKKLLDAVPIAEPGRRRNVRIPDEEIPTPLRRIGDEPAIVRLSEHQKGHFVAAF